LNWFFAPGDTIDDKINYRTTPILSDFISNSETLFFGSNGFIYALSI
jgi:hypothetical protein